MNISVHLLVILPFRLEDHTWLLAGRRAVEVDEVGVMAEDGEVFFEVQILSLYPDEIGVLNGGGIIPQKSHFISTLFLIVTLGLPYYVVTAKDE